MYGGPNEWMNEYNEGSKDNHEELIIQLENGNNKSKFVASNSQGMYLIWM